jgi:hypothetical protein
MWRIKCLGINTVAQRISDNPVGHASHGSHMADFPTTQRNFIHRTPQTVLEQGEGGGLGCFIVYAVWRHISDRRWSICTGG